MPDDFFEDLLREVDQANRLKKKKTPEFIQRPIQKPDALIICQIETTCNCGKVWESPNKHILLRYGRTMRKIKTWLMEYNSLPRELYEYKTTSESCRDCYEYTIWLANEVETPK